MENKKILEKIEKLLNLANSENQNEARIAAKKAHQLLDKYNLTMSQVGSEQVFDESVINESKRRDPVEWYVLKILQKFFYVKAYTQRSTNYTDFKRYTKTVLIGSEVNRQIAAYMYDFLKRSFKSLYKAERKAYGTTEIKYFYQGVFLGLCEQLENQRKQTEQETGLVIVPDAKLKEYVSRNYTFSPSKSGHVRGCAASKERGRTQGQNIQLRKGVGSNSTNSGKFLK